MSLDDKDQELPGGGTVLLTLSALLTAGWIVAIYVALNPAG